MVTAATQESQDIAVIREFQASLASAAILDFPVYQVIQGSRASQATQGLVEYLDFQARASVVTLVSLEFQGTRGFLASQGGQEYQDIVGSRGFPVTQDSPAYLATQAPTNI